MKIDEIRTAAGRVTAPGQPYALTEADVDGVRMRVFENAPQSLRELFRSGLAFENRDFYVYEDERYSFGDAWRIAARVAAGLEQRGVRHGDRVAIAMRNFPEWVFAFMGVTSLGAVAVALNGWWSGEELEYGISDSGTRLIFVDRERLDRIAGQFPQDALTIVAVRTPQEQCAARGAIAWDDFLPRDEVEMTNARVSAEDNATILYTSGSTAHPKGAYATHRSIIHAVMGWECGAAIALELNPSLKEENPEFLPSMIVSVPLFHVTGLNVQLNSSFRSGRKLVAMYKWDPEKALQIIESERITQFNGVPTMAYEMVQSPNFDQYDLRSLRSMGGGGAAMAPEHSRQISQRLKQGVPGTGYGMTETNGLATSISGPDLLERPRSCGRPVPPLVEIKIVDDAEREVPRGATGEIWIRGPMNFRGYWKQPEATRATLTEGWVRSGDIGHVDEEGFVFITDRKKDMVIRGGENVGCQEVEAVIYAHPAVAECVVFGVPDERLGETVAAVVVPKPGRRLGDAEIREHVGEHLARFKVPDHVWVRSERLPRIASEKIYKRGVRDEILRELSSRERRA